MKRWWGLRKIMSLFSVIVASALLTLYGCVGGGGSSSDGGGSNGGGVDTGIEPKPVKSDYLVGAYYWVSWDTQKVFTPYMDWNDSMFDPIIGRYNSTDTTVINWHIKWAVEHGISFFAIQFFETQLKAGFLEASYLPYIKFCFIAPIVLSATEDQDKFTQQIAWMSPYFNNSLYFRITGRPVIFILINYKDYEIAPEEESMLLSWIQNAKSSMKTTGINPYLIGTYSTIGDGIFTRTSQKLNKEFDAITTYSMAVAGGQTTPYEVLVSSSISLTKDWVQGTTAEGIGLIANVIPGFDDSLSYKHGTRDFLVVRPGSTPEKFKQMCEGVKPYIDPQNNVLMVTAWNEFSEGSVIEPTKENGFAYIDALRDVFCKKPPEGFPPNIIP